MDKSSNFDHPPKTSNNPSRLFPTSSSPRWPNVDRGLEGFPLQHHIAALRAQSHLDSIGHGIDATLKPRSVWWQGDWASNSMATFFAQQKMVHHWNFLSIPQKSEGKPKPTKNDYIGRSFFRNLSMFNKGNTFCNPWKNTTNWYSPRHIRTNWCSPRHLPNFVEVLLLSSLPKGNLFGCLAVGGLLQVCECGMGMGSGKGGEWVGMRVGFGRNKLYKCSISMAAITVENGIKAIELNWMDWWRPRKTKPNKIIYPQQEI